MTAFRKKPVVIEAEKVSELVANAAHNWKALPEWVRRAYENGKLLFLPSEINIGTLEGDMTASKDDWLIQGVAGEIYPCKPEIFEKTYETASTPTTDPAAGVRQEVIAAAYRPRPACRDCADHSGTCPHDGRLCDPYQDALRRLKADSPERELLRHREALTAIATLIDPVGGDAPMTCEQMMECVKAGVQELATLADMKADPHTSTCPNCGTQAEIVHYVKEIKVLQGPHATACGTKPRTITDKLEQTTCRDCRAVLGL